MPRLAFEEPKGGPLWAEPSEEESAERGRDSGRDTVVVVLKGATVAIAIALLGLIALLTTGGDDSRAKSPAVPDIPNSEQPAPTTSTSSIGAIVAPEVRTQTTAVIPNVPPPVTVPTQPTAEPPPPPGQGSDQFVRVGEPCDTRGAYAFTESFDPVVCDGGRQNERLVWRPIFR